MTVAQALAHASARLERAGIETPGLDAELLLRHVLGWDRSALAAAGSRALSAEAEGRFLELLEQRARRRPLQHLTGTQAFWRHEFLVTPGVFIPRPETELLVEAALDLLKGRAAPLVVDVGTGSGCIALSLAAERADAVVHATDISLDALTAAGENARWLGLAGRVSFHEGDLLAPVADLEGRIDLVVSNPPYVDPAELPALAPEVRDHEPLVALVPGDDGYSVYRRLVPQARRFLRPGGGLVLEVGQGQEREVRLLCEAAGLPVIRVIPDLQKIPRVVVAVRRTARA